MLLKQETENNKLRRFAQDIPFNYSFLNSDSAKRDKKNHFQLNNIY